MRNQIQLRKLLARKDTARIISRILDIIGSPVRIMDKANMTISGPGDASSTCRFPVELENEVIGWVTGEREAGTVAEIISHLALLEFEKKSLALDTLGKYKEITLLYGFSEKVASCHNLVEIAELAIHEIRKMVKADSITVAWYHGPGGGSEVIGATLQESDIIAEKARAYLIDHVLQKGVGEIVNEVSSDSRFALLLPSTHSLMFAPLKVGEKVTGLVMIQSIEPVSYSAGDLRLVGVIASGAAIASENVRYFEELLKTTAEKERAKSEMKLARDIQMSMVPRTFLLFPGRKDFLIYATLVPAKEVGGDFYNFFLVDRSHLCFVIGDVSGKGVPAALVMARIMTLIKMAACESGRSREILKKVNMEFSADNEQFMFVTMFCGILDTETGVVEYTNSGHNPPFVIRPNGTKELLEGAHATAVGFDEDTEYTSAEVALSPGDIILTYTDGVTEAMDKENQLFSMARLSEFISAKSGVSPVELVKELLCAVESFAVGMPQADDITIQAVQFWGKH